MRVIACELLFVRSLEQYVPAGAALDYPDGAALDILLLKGMVRPAEKADKAQISTEGAVQVPDAATVAPETAGDALVVPVAEEAPAPEAPADPTGQGSLQYADDSASVKAPIRRKKD